VQRVDAASRPALAATQAKTVCRYDESISPASLGHSHSLQPRRAPA